MSYPLVFSCINFKKNAPEPVEKQERFLCKRETAGLVTDVALSALLILSSILCLLMGQGAIHLPGLGTSIGSICAYVLMGSAATLIACDILTLFVSAKRRESRNQENIAALQKIIDEHNQNAISSEGVAKNESESVQTQLN